MAGFEINEHVGADGVTRLELAGEIDLSVSATITEAIRRVFKVDGLAKLAIDLEAVTFLDSTGIRALVTGHKLAQEHNAGYQVVNARGPVQRVLAITGLLAVLGGGSATSSQ